MLYITMTQGKTYKIRALTVHDEAHIREVDDGFNGVPEEVATGDGCERPRARVPPERAVGIQRLEAYTTESKRDDEERVHGGHNMYIPSNPIQVTRQSLKKKNRVEQTRTHTNCCGLGSFSAGRSCSERTSR